MSGRPRRDTGSPRREPSLAGQPDAEALLAAFAARPDASFAAGVVGPGGSGKSALVSAVVRAARRHGVATRRIRSGDVVPFPSDEDALLLVDDAHALDDATLAELTDVADDPDARLVVTARPWPAPRALSTLFLALGRARAPVTLAPLDVPGVVDRVETALDTPCHVELASDLTALSGGSPATLDRLLMLLRDAGPRAISLLGAPDAVAVPPGVLDLLRHELRALDDGSRRLLVALAVGAPQAPAALAEVLGVDRTALDDALDQARAAGLLLPDPDAEPGPGGGAELVPTLVGRALVRLGAAEERVDLERRIAAEALSRGASVLGPARRLLGAGLRGDQVARVFTTAGDEALTATPDLAGELYAGAVAAGAAPESVVLRRAEAAARAGDLDAALRLADPLTHASDEEERTRAVAVVAAAMTQRGMGRRAAQLLAGVPELLPSAVPGLVAHGDLTRATDVPEVAERGFTSLRAATRLTAEGILSSLGPGAGAAGTALSELARAAALLEPVGGAALLPDSPAVLAALVALHSGEMDVADSVLRRAVESEAGGPALAPRHLLWQAWVAMLRGDVAGLREHVATATALRPLEPRDELVAAALEVGVARRTGDAATLRTRWGRAREALVRHPVDLFSLLPVGELTVGAARLREQASMRTALEAADGLLADLGHPPLWTATTRWYGLAAAVTAEDVPSAEQELVGLRAAAGSSPLARTLAQAAEVWLAALSGEADGATVEEAARALHRLGWTWDGARLAGEAAIRTRDRRAMATLLACARSIADTGRPAADGTSAAHPGLPTSGSAGVTPEVSLSDREREVALLVLEGLTHKQIGARLFISSKTVEHHVARMRQRLGSTSRDELFARLRELTGGPG